ncbi:MAG: Gfo/Idh/MocA family oxidoreductase [bacterium]|nr:Gfo/Idh/MocA family oxidoreductase [bacterium]
MRDTDRQTVGCAVVGAGWWGTEAHIPAIIRHPRATLLAVQKRTREAAEKVAEDFGVPFACTTLDEVLAVAGLDAVVISSTPNAHYPQAMAALEKGCHVLIEKPMTMTAAQAEQLLHVAEKQGVHFLISCPWHYTARNIEARRLIQTGALGQLKMISVLMTNFCGGLYRQQPWEELFGDGDAFESASAPYQRPGRESYSDPAVAGGGQIYCQVSHVAAHLAFLTGARAIEVFARFDQGGTQVDVYDTLNIKLDNGALVAIASTGATMLSERNYEVRIYGEQGMLHMELWQGTMAYHDGSGKVRSYPALDDSSAYPIHAPAQNLIDLILGEAENGRQMFLGAMAMDVIEAACTSVATGRNVTLP